jgi:hypothetical protein
MSASVIGTPVEAAGSSGVITVVLPSVTMGDVILLLVETGTSSSQGRCDGNARGPVNGFYGGDIT